jgi:hypothetical protein
MQQAAFHAFPQLSASWRSTVLPQDKNQAPFAERQKLLDVLERIERHILRLRDRLARYAKGHTEHSVQRIIALIREDERVLRSLCIAHVNVWHPEQSVEHDLTNNDDTMTLWEELALSTKFGWRERIITLHRLQREICARLKELGIDRSANAHF